MDEYNNAIHAQGSAFFVRHMYHLANQIVDRAQLWPLSTRRSSFMKHRAMIALHCICAHVEWKSWRCFQGLSSKPISFGRQHDRVPRAFKSVPMGDRATAVQGCILGKWVATDYGMSTAYTVSGTHALSSTTRCTLRHILSLTTRSV